jgi:hypothetical protein
VTHAWLNRIDTVVPSPDIHAAFVEFGSDTMVNRRKRALFDRMANLSDIQHRYAIIEPCPKPSDKVLDAVGFYQGSAFPSAAAPMALCESHVLDLAIYAVRRPDADPAAITHVIVASRTDVTGPGLDLQIMCAVGASAALFTAQLAGVALGRVQAGLFSCSHDLITGSKVILPEPPAPRAVRAGGKSRSGRWHTFLTCHCARRAPGC